MMPIVWLVLIVFFVIAEALTYGLVTIWFAGGALAAAIAAFMDTTLLQQVLIFSGVSLLLLLVTRPLAKRFMAKDTPKSSVNSHVGHTAIVTEEIDNRSQKGKVRIYDVDWLAVSASDEEVIPVGSVVLVKEVRGVRLIVEKQ